MADIHVEILSDGTGPYPTYPEGNKVRHGDRVIFHVACAEAVLVSFTSNSCLTSPGPFHLDGRDPAQAASPPLGVSSSAVEGPYRFSVAPVGKALGALKRGELEAKPGELDVTTDPPPPEEEEER